MKVAYWKEVFPTPDFLCVLRVLCGEPPFSLSIKRGRKMTYPQGAFEQTGTTVTAVPDARFECGICWHVYDPAEGDAIGRIPPGTAFTDLPEHWACPNCEAPRHKFLKLAP
jgi:rubredoxin